MDEGVHCCINCEGEELEASRVPISPGTEVVKWNGCKLLSTTQQSEPMDQTYIKEHGEFKV